MDYETIVKGMTKEAWKGTAIIFIVVAALGVVGLLAPPGIVQGGDYYQAYTLNDQYVGDITVGDTQYQDVLIMDVTYQEYAYGSTKLHTGKTYGLFDVVVYDSKYLGESDKTGQLYFAGEHETQDRLTTGKTIVARWVKGGDGAYHIKGIFNYDEVDLR